LRLISTPISLALVLALALGVCSCQGKKATSEATANADSLATEEKKNNKKKNDKNDEEGGVPVEIGTAAKRTVCAYVTATSTLEAKRTAQLLAETTGQIASIRKEEGDWVKKGEVLLKVEDTQERLDFEKAGIDLEVAEKEWQRAEELQKKDILSSKEFDEKRLRWEEAKHAKARARYALDKTAVVAPFSGIVTERNVQLGETVTPGKHVSTVADFNPLVVKFHVPESEANPVRLRQPVAIEIPSVSSEPLDAEVALISPVIDQGTGTVKLTAYLDNPDFSIRPGTFVRVKVTAATHDSALTIPRRALLSENDTHYVFVAHSDTTARVEVEAGITDGQYVEILSGLSVGDPVITIGHGGLKSGDKIKIVTEK
jgi:membrane fusion protein (multidrug efflux system)